MKIMLMLGAAALAVLPACSDDGDTSDDTTTTEPAASTESTETTEDDEPTSSTTEESTSSTAGGQTSPELEEVLAEVEAAEDYCEAVGLLSDASETLVSAEPTAAEMEEFFAFTDAVLYELLDLVPPELEEDYQVAISVWPEYYAAAEEVGFDPVALADPEITALTEEGEVGEANDAVDQYNTEECQAQG